MVCTFCASLWIRIRPCLSWTLRQCQCVWILLITAARVIKALSIRIYIFPVGLAVWQLKFSAVWLPLHTFILASLSGGSCRRKSAVWVFGKYASASQGLPQWRSIHLHPTMPHPSWALLGFILLPASFRLASSWLGGGLWALSDSDSTFVRSAPPNGFVFGLLYHLLHLILVRAKVFQYFKRFRVL